MAVRFRLAEVLEERKDDFPSQAELARQSGVSTVTINAIVKGRTDGIKLDTLNQLCVALDCTPGDLIEYVPDRKPGKRAR